MQEDIENRSVALTVNATRFTARTLARACMWLLRQMKQGDLSKYQETLREQIKKGEAPSVPFSGNKLDFHRFARKHKVNYEIEKLASGKYRIYFKAAQAENIKDCLADYAKSIMGKGKGLSIAQELQKGAEKVKAAAPLERVRTRGIEHDR